MPELRPDHLLPILAPFAVADRAWIAFSGGLDSTVLLHALASVRERLPCTIRAVHVDHRLQPASTDWVRHCDRFCRELNLCFTALTVAASPARSESPEAQARAARYRALAELLSHQDLVLTAHHQDDQAETLLLALLRGGGVHGLAAMPTVTRLGDGRLVRPLLAYARADLERYAEQHRLNWIDDPSNASLDYDRNRLRRQVIPLLRRRWPAVARTLARSAAHCAEAARVVDQAAANLLEQLCDDGATLPIPELRSLTPELRRATLRYWLRRRALPVPDSVHLKRVEREVLGARADADPLVAWGGCEIRRYRTRLYALHPLPPRPGAGPGIRWIGQELALPQGLGRLQWRGPVSDDNEERHPVVVRFGLAGVRLRARPGGHRRPLKKLFQEAGIPPWLRPYVPLIFADGTLIAIAGVTPPADTGGPEPRVRWLDDPWQELGFFNPKEAAPQTDKCVG